MNRIILIGNGFDLAHDLKTSYKDFIKDFWKKQTIDYNNQATSLEGMKWFNKNNVFFEFSILPPPPLKENFYKTQKISYKNKFLEVITDEFENKNWVDIEEHYNVHLQEIVHGSIKARKYWRVDWLNRDFEIIKKLLETYLKDEVIINDEKKFLDKIKNIIFSKFVLDDFTQVGVETIIDEEYHKLRQINERTDYQSINNLSETTFYLLRNLDGNNIPINKEEIRKILIKKTTFSQDFHLLPRQILFLNFNYTNTENRYYKYDFFKDKTEGFKKEIQIEKDTIHIHGELMNDKNPIIFGYGDEIANEYKAIEKMNDNRFLENIKSIRYLETDNYKRLLNFINSDNYQIFIMGHSCGLSDRTLLNTLFEHENCVSIKVFYHQETETRDNYSDVVRNISRNFNNKATMREKVVNKQYCESLI